LQSNPEHPQQNFKEHDQTNANLFYRQDSRNASIDNKLNPDRKYLYHCEK